MSIALMKDKPKKYLRLTAIELFLLFMCFGLGGYIGGVLFSKDEAPAPKPIYIIQSDANDQLPPGLVAPVAPKPSTRKV